ncbi:MAG: hypothetical protein JSW58_04560 [Candidatus Latescibacterota bacterium]|nr:MAG: hypothetical protein JSW58_04560 [Candidatus Latescibacterota bacterium]
MTRRIWKYTAILISSAMILALSGPNLSAQQAAPRGDIPKEEFDKMLKGYSELESASERGKQLVTLFVQAPSMAFDTVYEALVSDSGVVREEAARLIGHYYAVFQVFSWDSRWKMIEEPDHSMEKRDDVVDKLHWLRSAGMIRGRVYALESLVRMGEADEQMVDEILSVALGEGAEEWQYFDSTDTQMVAVTTKELELDYRKEAVGLLVALYSNGVFAERTLGHLKTIIKGLDPDTRYYETLMGNPMLRAIASQM